MEGKKPIEVFTRFIQGVTGGTDQTSGGCSLCQTITKKPKTPISKVQWLRRYRPEKSVEYFGVCVLYSICDVILGVSEGWAQSTTIAFPRYR